MGRRCPHYHFATIDGSKCPSSAREVKTSLVPLFPLFFESQTQLHSVLPARMCKDIPDINKVRLWAPPGGSIISTFSRTNHLTNLTCPGQTRESCSRAEGTTQTPGHLAHAFTLVVGGTWDGDWGQPRLQAAASTANFIRSDPRASSNTRRTTGWSPPLSQLLIVK